MPSRRASFTLIELLIVIAIVAVLSVVVLLTLNPAELLKQAKDSNRLADMDTLNRAMLLYIQDKGGSLGTASTTYLSLVDPTATSTAGTNCAGVGFVPQSGWSYHCAASSTVRKIDGTGWIPLNFSNMTFSPPMGSLPVDPTNTSSSGLFYVYVPGTTTYALAAQLDSVKFLASKAAGDQKYDPARYETGSNLALMAQAEGLKGWWEFEDGSGLSAADSSGNGNTGTLQSSTGWGAGKVGNGLAFNGTTQYVSLPLFNSTSGVTVSAWFNRSVQDATNADAVFGGWYWDANAQLRQAFDLRFYINDPTLNWIVETTNGSSLTEKSIYSGTLSTGTWYHAAATYDSTTGISKIYVNGALASQSSASAGNTIVPQAAYADMRIGHSRVNSGYFQGTIDDVRVYNRALTAAEILAIYNAQK